MALEIGGRADKDGNWYENYFLGKQLLLLAEEKLKTVEVEPLGDEGQGVEYTVVQSDNTRAYYQCKATNGTKPYWSVADLAAHKVFENAKAHILRSEKNEFHFISPLSYKNLDDLCVRARRNHSAADYIKYQITNEALKRALKDVEAQLKLSQTNPVELQQLVYILSKCFFEQVPNTQDGTQDTENMVGWFFDGNAKAARLLLENYVNDQGKYGVALSPHDIISFMQQMGHGLRDFGKDERVWQRIQILNDTYWEAYSPISGTLLPRAAANSAIKRLVEGTSVILHGKAGTGKSGCVELVSNYLRKNNILFLRLKLDKNIPRNSSVQFGQDLGLPDSPVRCLQKIAGCNRCVLILDQLDALRWTAPHSPTALAVCKELISEVEVANRYHNANISVMFVTRSFDYKCDAHIKNLFVSNKEKEGMWKEIEVDALSDSEVSEIVGRCYASLSKKLKELLRTPASLYVWMQLDEVRQAQVITSVHQLLHKWWIQILEHYAQKSIASLEMDNFIQDVANQMSSIGVFSLPRKPLAAREQIIKALVSEGLLVDNDSKVIFMHQIYLDYFVVNSYVTQVIAGTPVIDILGTRDHQTPNLRYRFFVLLQELCEQDEALFIEQCEKILNSDHVRHYYKCIVFDAAAQQASPSNDFCAFIEKYWSTPDWHEYIRQVVYFGNYPLIEHMVESEKIACLSNEGIWLLRSINEKVPDFIANTLKPYCSKNTEMDRKIYSCLCSDADDDSDTMYQLRLELLRNNPALLEDAWTSYLGLFKDGSPRILDYLLLILDNSGNIKPEAVYFPDRKELKAFAKEHYQMIVDAVIPKLCRATAGMASKANKLWYADSYTRWIAKDYNEGALRKIVQIAKIAICAFAEQHPDELLQKLVCEEHSDALVGNELILVALENLSLEFSDAAIEWITEAFPKHIFDFTGYGSDYLAITKRILTKFTPHCTPKVFKKLEQCIMSWSESSGWMVSMFKRRLENSKTRPVYYAYWGFMQKELLPPMDQHRLSVTAKELLAVLNRNEWVRIPHYAYPISGGQVKGVTSPVSEYTDRISDKTWLQIIQTPPEKMKVLSGKETKSAYIEANHEQFAVSLGAQAKKQPVRFANLCLHFPEKCYSGYISQVLCAQENRDQEDTYADIELTSQIIRKYSGMDNQKILGNIADVVESRAKETWPEDILDIIQSIALTPVAKSSSRNFSDDSEKMAYLLYNDVLNTPQGKAIRAITSLLFAESAYFTRFKGAISTLATSSEPFVLLALTDCMMACYNADEDFSLAIFKVLLTKDVRLFIAHNAWKIIRRDYEKESSFYREGLLAAIKSEYADLGEHAASMLCAAAIYYEDSEAQKLLFDLHFTDKQANSICKRAVSSFANDKHREISKKIILRMVQEHTTDFYALSSDFFQENTHIERDKDFLLQLVNANAKARVLVELLKFLCKTGENILDFAEVIYAVTKHAAIISDDRPMRISMDEMVRCVAHLYDVGKDRPECLTICLDTWDELFRNNLRDIQSLSTMLDNFN